MKKYKSPELVVTLLFVVACLLWHFLGKAVYFHARYFFQHQQLLTLWFYLPYVVIGLLSMAVFFFTRYCKEKIFRWHKQYYNLFDLNPTPIAIAEIKTKKVLAVNRAAVLAYGYTYKELLKMKLLDLRVDDDCSTLEDNIDENELSNNGVCRHRKKNGEIIWVEVMLGKVVFANKKCVLLMARDITEITRIKEEKRIAEEERIKQETFTSYVLSNFPVDVAVFDKDHRYLWINKTAVKNDEIRKWMIGKDDFDYFALKGTNFSIAHKRREFFLKAIAGDCQAWIDKHVVNGQVKYVMRKFLPYIENGEIKYVYGYGIDITGLEKSKLQSEQYIRQLEKIAFETSHKVRQPICNLQGLIAILEMEMGKEPCIEGVIVNMQKSVYALDQHTRDLAQVLHEYKQNISVTQNLKENCSNFGLQANN